MSSFLNVSPSSVEAAMVIDDSLPSSIIRHLPFQFDQVREGDTSERLECYGLPREVLPERDVPCSEPSVG